jgi:hypothetical protein
MLLNLEVEIERVLGLPVVLAAEFVGPPCVVFDQFGEVFEEFPVGVRACCFDFGAAYRIDSAWKNGTFSVRSNP